MVKKWKYKTFKTLIYIDIQNEYSLMKYYTFSFEKSFK